MQKYLLKYLISISIFMFTFFNVNLVAADDTLPNDQRHSFTDNLQVCSSKNLISIDSLIESSYQEKLIPCQLTGLSIAELRLIRNGIYAKHGRKFDNPQLQSFFNAKSWYKINNSYSPDDLAENQATKY